MKPKFKALIVLGIEFIAIVVILILILFAGKKVYTVTFDLNEGTLISGELVQRVTQGQNATAPNVTRDGCYLLGWTNSYTKVTHNVTTRAIWEYNTTEGIEYEIVEDSNYCKIKRCYPDITGDVYIGLYYDNKKVLEIEDGAFKDCKYITGVYLLDGILNIGESAFENCVSLEVIDIPSTTVNIKANAFKNCTSLVKVELNEGLKSIGDYAFKGCENLELINIPTTLEEMGVEVFDSEKLTITYDLTIDEAQEFENYCLESTIIEYKEALEEDDEEHPDKKKKLDR